MTETASWPPGAEQAVVDFLVGGALAVLGGLLLVATLLVRRSVTAWRYLGFFALTLGAVTVLQSAPLSLLLGKPDVLWSLHVTFGILIPVGLVGFVHVFFDAPSRHVRAFEVVVVSYAALALVLMRFGVSRMPLRQVGYLPTLFGAGWSALIAVRARRRQHAGTTEFLAGLAVLVAFALIDIAHGFGLLLDAVTISGLPWGELCFVTALALMLVQQALRQQDQLSAAAAELRHQVEARSRELREALAGQLSVTQGDREHEPGTLIGGRYRVVRTLGRGAMGRVYEAQRESDSLRVAVKTMLGSTSREDAARFAREAEVAARMRHENLVGVLDVGADRGELFLAMEFVSGHSLDKLEARYGQPAFASRVARQVAQGLVALHQAGVGHRDLKPANVLIDEADGEVRARIADFGLARSLHDVDDSGEGGTVKSPSASDEVSRAGHVAGTPKYMAPEQVRGQPSLASDVFSFALMTLEVFGHAWPFEQLSFEARLAGLEPKRVRPVSLPDERLTRVLERCLAHDASARPSMAEVLSAL